MTTLDPPRTLVGAPDPDEPHDSAGDQPSRDDQCRIVAGGPSSLDGHACDGAQRRAAVEGPNSAARHMTTDTHRAFADGGSRPLDGHRRCDGQSDSAVEGPIIDPGQPKCDAQARAAGVEQNIRDDHRSVGTHAGPVIAEQSPSAPALDDSAPSHAAPGRADPIIDPGHSRSGDQRPNAGVEQSPSGATLVPAAPNADASRPADPIIDPGQSSRGDHEGPAGVEQAPPGPAKRESSATEAAPVLADPFLALAADVLDDLERVRVANENRLRQLTRTATDADGEDRGFGLDERHPDVARLSALVDALRQAEHDAELQLGRTMRRHPLGPWVKATVGIGIKQGARLLAAIGDPYIRPELIRKDGTVEPSRPRRVSELWAYTGYHVLRSGQSGDDNQSALAGAAGGDPGHRASEAHTRGAGVAPTPRRGQRCNWSTSAKMRAFLIAESCVKQTASPYRVVYDEGRVKYADAVHATECRRCGPSGHPAAAGSPLSAGHQHARALRLVAKRVLRDLWRESRALHQAAAS